MASKSRNATQVRPNTRLCAPAGTSQRYARASARAAALSAATRHTGSSPSVSRKQRLGRQEAHPPRHAPARRARRTRRRQVRTQAPLPSCSAHGGRARPASMRSARARALSAPHPDARRKAPMLSSSATSYMLPFTDFFTLSLAVGSGKPYNRNDSKNRPLRHIVRASCPASAAAWDAGSPAEAGHAATTEQKRRRAMCTNGINTGQFEQMISQIDDHVKLERRWAHNLAHQAEDAGLRHGVREASRRPGAARRGARRP